MTTTAPVQKLSIKELRAEAQRLGITAQSAGCPVDDLLRTARENDDPLGYLAIHAPGGPSPKEPGANDSETKPAESETDPTAIGEDLGAMPLPSLTVTLVSVDVPLLDVSLNGCYVSDHVEVRISQQQRLVLRRLYLALDANGARLANGRHVDSPADAIRWLLEQIAGNHDA